MVAEKIHKFKEQLFDRGIKAFAVFGLLALIGSLARIAYAGWHPVMLLHISLYVVVLLLVFFGSHVSYPLRVGILSGTAFVLGFGALIGGGFAVFGLLVLGIFCILSTIFMGTKAGIVSSIINIIAVSSIGIGVHAGIIHYKYSPILDLNHSAIWIVAIIALAMMMGIVVVILGTLNRQMEDLAHTLQKQNDEITEKNRLLENDIAERIRMEEERRALEGKLQLAQKMEMVGKLAGGVAHDLNNILGSVIGYPELILMDLPANSQLREPIETIMKTGIKAAAIVNDMLTLTRSGVRDTKVFDLNSVIDDYFKSSQFDQLMLFHPKTQIELKTHKSPVNVQGSFYHLSKVVMNLVSNAAEAMPDGGKMIVSTNCQFVGESGQGDGDLAVLSVSDTGVGILKSELEKIFEPFYTKKTMGRSGTGLGMTVVWNSVKEHNGHIDVDSVEGKGTCFTVYLPLTKSKVTVEPVLSSQADFHGRGETILVVDDVPEQQKIAVSILSQLGYRVHAVASGEEAIEYLSGAPVDLLILDMIMDPGIDGLDTFKRILEMYPSQKAIIVSGFSQTHRAKEAISLGAGAYLKKPFLFNQIGYAVKEELNKTSKEDSNPERWN
jgi:signal transduction histidine kinase/ActR/RegA family two-component response regulator